MENHQYKIYYNQYISALKKLIDAQNKARKLFPSILLPVEEENPDWTLKEKMVVKQLNKAYKVYAEKSKAWRNYLQLSQK